jgi:hypothetical protein
MRAAVCTDRHHSCLERDLGEHVAAIVGARVAPSLRELRASVLVSRDPDERACDRRDRCVQTRTARSSSADVSSVDIIDARSCEPRVCPRVVEAARRAAARCAGNDTVWMRRTWNHRIHRARAPGLVGGQVAAGAEAGRPNLLGRTGALTDRPRPRGMAHAASSSTGAADAVDGAPPATAVEPGPWREPSQGAGMGVALSAGDADGSRREEDSH